MNKLNLLLNRLHSMEDKRRAMYYKIEYAKALRRTDDEEKAADEILQVIAKKDGYYMTFEEIAAELGISRNQAAAIHRDAMKKIFRKKAKLLEYLND